MVDLSKLKTRDTVKFQCGGEAEIRKVYDISAHRINLIFTEEPNHHYNYMHDGSLTGAWGPRIFDIIEIIPAAFDWATVKPRMAFDDGEGLIRLYIGESLTNSSRCVTCSLTYDNLKFTLKSYLTRAPEHDIKVPG